MSWKKGYYGITGSTVTAVEAPSSDSLKWCRTDEAICAPGATISISISPKPGSSGAVGECWTLLSCHVPLSQIHLECISGESE